jgi:hypothetical protein
MTLQRMTVSPETLETIAWAAHKEIERDPDTERLRVVHAGVEYVAALPLRCGSEGCGELATTAIRLADHGGHVHDCDEHTAVLHALSFVTETAPIQAGRCPWPCTDLPIYTDTPTTWGRTA